jgi:hypothetical protein
MLSIFSLSFPYKNDTSLFRGPVKIFFLIHNNMQKLFIALFVVISFIGLSHGHGRFVGPPSRSSAWRFGFDTPINYNDHELYCGGMNVQWQQHGGNCGMCGDNYGLPVPRPNEFGGSPYGVGVIVATYQAGQTIRLDVELTQSHLG